MLQYVVSQKMHYKRTMEKEGLYDKDIEKNWKLR